MSRDVFVSIDRVVVHGLEHLEARDLAAALQDALAEQLAATPAGGQSADIARVGTRIDLPHGCTAAQLGQALASSLADSLGGVIGGDGPESGADSGPLAGASGDA